MRLRRQRPEPEPLEARLLRPFVFTPASLPAVAIPVAREILPGLQMVPVLSEGSRIDFLEPATIAALGGADAVVKRAVRNLGAHPRPEVVPFEATPGDPDTTCYALGSEDPFAASVIAGLDLLPALLAPAVSPRYGVLVAVPYWRMALLHVLRGSGGLESLVRIARMTDELHGSGGIPPRERLSDQVFYVAPDGRTQVVAHRDPAGPVVETRGLIREHYFVPAGVPLGG